MNPRPLALRGVRILDLTMGWAGPLGARYLADEGAEVIKIEGPGHFDWWRGWDLGGKADAAMTHEKSPNFNYNNRNKRGVAIDLTRPEGRALALRLAETCDAAIENQATGVMAKLGLTYEDLKAVNPSIIMLSMPGFGAEGPWSAYRAYGSTVEQSSGLPHLTGRPEDPPAMCHIAYGDAAGGMHAAAMLLTALFHRRRTGEGQRLDLAQVEGLMQFGIHGPITQSMTGAPPERLGRRHPLHVPHGVFPCTAEDTWVAAAVTVDEAWPALARLLGREDWAGDPALTTPEGRRAIEDEIEAALATFTAQRTPPEAAQALRAAGVAVAPVIRSADLLEDELLNARGFWAQVERAHVGVKPHPLTPWTLDGQRTPIRSPAPTLGEHTEAVLRDLLDLGDGEIADLRREGVLA
ncbi:CoA transferase [Albimonas sp. CAU 1670]|uniref:CaiB/BaiF CoA transferase family protein n=1 Tax=Albimonas sp. CAU 1670 TaxID=3032599 RepID=UPI0023DC8EF9|nr:CoA transferase [Albimonas sp. CAU 1670]MDF2231758.1 CoA transferase [Albimonas sp. CAU 1670]